MRRLIRVIIAVLAMVSFFVQNGIWHSVAAQNALDLSSANQSYSAQPLLKDGATAVLQVGGSNRSVTSTSALTAAEYMALTQILSGGRQALKLDASGRAVAGSFSLNHAPNPYISSLVIPQGVTGTNYSSTPLNLSGALNVQGLLVGLPAGTAANVFNINAGSVLVGSSGGIATKLTSNLANLLSSLPSARNQLSMLTGLGLTGRPLDLSLTSASDIVNQGLIAASGKLNLSAAGSIINQGGTAGGGVIASVGNAALYSGAGQINNSGIVAVQSGNLALDGAHTSGFLVNNQGGQMLATAGDILLGNPLYTGTDATRLLGGKLSAQQINAFGGAVSLDADRLDGLVNVSGCSAFVSVKEGDLLLGQALITGDPTVQNSGGDVLLTNNLSFPGQNLAILASGNVEVAPGSTVTSIDVSSTGAPGALHIVAGFDFTNTSGQNYRIDGPSASGGDVNLPGVQLNTSSTNNQGGVLTVVAHGGAASAGKITVGAMNASSANAQGGTVTMIGQGGITAQGNISAGGTRGGAIFLVGTDPTTTGTVVFQDGTITGGTFAGGLPNSAANLKTLPTITVTGTMDASGSVLQGGVVNPISSGKVSVGAVTVNGGSSGAPGGIFQAISLNAPLSTGSISANGGSGAASAGQGGVVQLSSPVSVAVTGSVRADGGNNGGATAGGKGGTLQVVTSASNPNVFFTGGVSVSGVMSAVGGTSTAGTGGQGGTVQVSAGTVRVSGNVNGNSVTTAGGAGTATGAGGIVTLHTYGTQNIPANFNLTSTAKTEIALAGGLFTVGDASVNGTAGNITTGPDTATPANAGHVTNSNQFISGNLRILVDGSSATLNENGTNVVINSDVGGTRTKVTPAEALALYLVTRNSGAGSQTVGLTSGGAAKTLNPANNDSFAVVNNFDLPEQFTTFNLQTVEGDGHITLQIVGSKTTLNMPVSKAATIAGGITFASNSVAQINFGGQTMNLPYGSTITGGGVTLTLTGKNATWTNNGRIQVGTLIIDHQGKALTLNQDSASQNLINPGSAGLLLATNGIVLRNPKASLNIKNGAISGLISTDDTDGLITALKITAQLSNVTALGNVASSSNLKVFSSSGGLQVAPGANISSGALLSLQSIGTGNVIIGSGAVLTSGLTLSTNNANPAVLAADGTITDLGATYNFLGVLQLQSSNGITLSPGTQLNGAAGISIGATDATGSNNAPITINGSFLEADKLAVNIFASGLVTIGAGTTIIAGSLKPTAPSTGVLAKADLNLSASIVIASLTGVNIQESLVANGGNLQVLVGPPASDPNRVGNINLGSGLNFDANGGNIFMLVKNGQVSGSGETFTVRAVGTAQAFRGGGIELGGGLRLAQSNLLTYFRTRGPQVVVPILDGTNHVSDPALLGSNVLIAGSTAPGTVASNLKNGGTVDISNSTITINRGAVVLDALEAGSGVNVLSSTFNAAGVAYAPKVTEATSLFNSLQNTGSLFGFVTGLSGGTVFLSKDFKFGEAGSQFSDILGGNIGGRSILQIFGSTSQFANTSTILATIQVSATLLSGGNFGSQQNTFNTIMTPSVKVSTDTDDGDDGSGGSAKQDDNSKSAEPRAFSTDRSVIHVNQLRSDLLFFTQASQMIQGNLGGASDAMIFGAPGTAITNGQTVVILHTGHLVADTGKDSLTLSTSAGDITLAPNSTVAIDADASGTVKIKALASSDQGGISFKGNEDNPHNAELKSGDVLFVGDSELKDEDLIPVSGGDNVVVSGGVVETKTKRGKFSVAQFADRMMPTDRMVRLGTARKHRTGQRMSDHVRAAAKTQVATTPHHKFAQAKGVQFGDKGAPVHILAAVGTEFKREPSGSIKVLGGSMFVECSEDTDLETTLGKVSGKSGATFGVELDKNVLKVKSCAMPGQVLLDAGDQHVNLRAGQEIIIGAQKLAETDVMPEDGVGRRSMTVYSDGKNHVAFTEFSIGSLLKSTTYLRPLNDRTNKESARHLDALMKVAAAAEVLGMGHGRYQMTQTNKPAQPTP